VTPALLRVAPVETIDLPVPRITDDPLRVVFSPAARPEDPARGTNYGESGFLVICGVMPRRLTIHRTAGNSHVVFGGCTLMRLEHSRWRYRILEFGNLI
jgi:hypothetical protein